MIETTKMNSLKYVKECVISDRNADSGAERKLSPVRVNPVLINNHERRVKISGGWKFKLDPEGVGLDERWFENADAFSENILVPGCWQGQGFGNDEEDEIADFRLKAKIYKATYIGTGWYCKKFLPPSVWRGSRIMLNFGGVHPSAQVWLNGMEIGSNITPFVPFGFNVSDVITFDKENILVVQVHEQNRMLGFTYNFQGNWSGLYRDVELVATGQSYIKQFRIYPHVLQSKMSFKVLTDIKKSKGKLTLEVSTHALEESQSVKNIKVAVNNKATEFEMSIESPLLWSPDSPSLYRVDVLLEDENGNILDAFSERTGFVKLSTEKKHFLINDEPYYMRGTGDFVSCPETGYPDTDRDRWRKKLKALREYGYNYVRCQSFVYGPEYYDVADEVGLIIQSEMGMLGNWGGHSIYHVYPWPQPTIDNFELLKEQWDKVVLRDVNHPSANIYCMSNECWSNMSFPRVAWQCYHETKKMKPTAFVIWTDGGYREDLPGDFVNDEANVINPCSSNSTTSGMLNRGNMLEKCDKPLIQHEFRWWSSFPDIRLMEKYSGAVRPYGAELALKTALYRGIEHILIDAAKNSQREQFVEAKYEMELCRRGNVELAGISHFNAMDSNSSPQGIIDEFYEKKFADSVKWLQTNGDTVILCDIFYDTSVYSSGDRLCCSFSVSDFSHPALKKPVLVWKLVSENVELFGGELVYTHIPYRTCEVGKIDIIIPEVSKPKHSKLVVELTEENRMFNNNWDIWLFPKESAIGKWIATYGKKENTWLKDLGGKASTSISQLNEADKYSVVLTEVIDEDLVNYIKNGGHVIFTASEGLTRPSTAPWNTYGNGRYFFSPPANYPTYEDGINGTIIKNHPALGDMPHEGFADLQFFRMIGNSAPIDIGALGLTEGEPIIRAIHSYIICRPLAYLIEYSLGKGGILICSMDLNQSWPEARYLLAKLCDYAASDGFKPEMKLHEEALRRILVASRIG